MTVLHVKEKTSVAEILDAAHPSGVLIHRGDGSQYAVMPLDDDLIDYLLERSPKFRADCERIRLEMKAGKYTTLDEAEKLFADQ